MPGKFNYKVLRKYPHLIGEDTEVWTRFIRKFPQRFDTVDYDVLVGKGVDTSTISDIKFQQYWSNLTKKRIDVIGWKNEICTIVEVKKRVSLMTLGQILGYRFLFGREHPEITLVSALTVCSTIDQDDRDVLEHYGIEFVIV